MATENPTHGGDSIAPDTQDAKVELAVLAFLLHEHPDRLTIPEALGR